MDTATEQLTMLAFVKPERRPRCAELVQTRKGRKKIIAQLAHGSDLDDRYRVSLPATVHDAKSLVAFLKLKGAGPTCYVMSEDTDLDATCMSLDAAIAAVYGRGIGTIVSCIPGQLAYYEAEYADESCVLKRTRSRQDPGHDGR